MHRIDGPGATVDNKFTEGNPASSVPATQVTAAWLNEVQEEMLSILAGASIAPVKGDQDQVLTAIQAMIAASIPAASTDGIAGGFANLKASATGLSAAVSITADALCVKSAAGQQKVLGAVAVAPSFAISGVNGLDVGAANSQAANTWYYLWAIWDGTTTAGLLSLSPTAPTMPSGYTHKARVGAIRTDGTANKYPVSFTQSGRRIQYKPAAGSNLTALPAMASGSAGAPGTPTFVAVAVGAFVPPTAGRIAVVGGTGANASGIFVAAPSNAYGAQNGSNPPPLSSISSSGSVVAGDMVLESTNIYWASSTSTAVLNCSGWEDNL